MIFTNFTTLLLYLTTFVSSSLLMREHQKAHIKLNKNKYFENIFLILSLIIPSLVAGLRYNTGTDYQSYYWLFQLTKGSSITGILDMGSEPLFLIIMKIISILRLDNIMFMIMFWLTISFIYLSLRKFKDINWGYGLFLWYLIAFSPSLNIMRQMLAVSVVLYAVVNLYEKKYLKYFIFMLIAVLIHNIAIIGLVALILQSLNKYFDSYRIIVILFLFFIIPFISEYIVSFINIVDENRFEVYTSLLDNFSFFPALRVLPSLLPVIFFRKKIKYLFGNSSLFINLKIFELFFRLFFSTINYGFRVAYFFNVSDVILISMLLASVKSKNSRFVLTLFIFIFYISIYYFNSFINLNDGVVPYILGVG